MASFTCRFHLLIRPLPIPLSDQSRECERWHSGAGRENNPNRLSILRNSPTWVVSTETMGGTVPLARANQNISFALPLDSFATDSAGRSSGCPRHPHTVALVSENINLETGQGFMFTMMLRGGQLLFPAALHQVERLLTGFNGLEAIRRFMRSQSIPSCRWSRHSECEPSGVSLQITMEDR